MASLNFSLIYVHFRTSTLGEKNDSISSRPPAMGEIVGLTGLFCPDTTGCSKCGNPWWVMGIITCHPIMVVTLNVWNVYVNVPTIMGQMWAFCHLLSMFLTNVTSLWMDFYSVSKNAKLFLSWLLYKKITYKQKENA